jgi:hypothetical protein
MIKGSDIETGGTGTRLKPMNIYTKIALKDIEVEDGFVEITFVDPETRLVAINRLWEPKGKFPNEKTNSDGTKTKETVEEAKTREMISNLSHLTTLVELAFGKDAKNNMAAEDYNSFVNLAITLLKPIYEKGLFNLKVVMDENGYAKIGRYPRSYIELYQEGVAPSLKFDPYEIATAAKAKPAIKKEKTNPLGGLFDNVE